MATNLPVLILAVSWTETVLGLIFFCLRFVSNWKVTRRFNWDLALAGLTLVSSIASIKSKKFPMKPFNLTTRSPIQTGNRMYRADYLTTLC